MFYGVLDRPGWRERNFEWSLGKADVEKIGHKMAKAASATPATLFQTQRGGA